jgi:hypothetical protein
MDAWATTAPSTVMPFGRHRGKPLSEVPTEYLRWALANATAMGPELREQVEAVLGFQAPSMPFMVEAGPAEAEEAAPPDASDLAAINQHLRDLRKEDAALIKKANAEVARIRKGWDDDKVRLANAQTEVKQLKRALAEASREKVSDPAAFRRVVKQWYGAVSRRFHPDMGGSAASQVVANVCYQELIERLDQMEKNR